MIFSYRAQRRIPSLKERFLHWRDPPHFSMRHLDKVIPESEVKVLCALQDALSDHQISKSKVTLFYPGSGGDIIRPLSVLQAVARGAKQWNVVCQDPAETIGHMIGLVQAITGVIPHRVSGDAWESHAVFGFADRDVRIELWRSDALQAFPSSASSYDIYLDRAFEIVRAKEAAFTSRVVTGLARGGIAITDARFGADSRWDCVSLPIEWGFYKDAACHKRI